MQKLVGLTTLGVSLVLLHPGRAAAASFDCAKEGQDAVAKAICSDPALNQLDAEMGVAYQALFQLQGTRALASQRRWLQQRTHCGPDPIVPCLTRWTQWRLAQLQAKLAEAQRDPELLGKLSAGWAKDDDLGEHRGEAKDSLNSCPQAALDLAARDAALVPQSYVPLEALATHRCDAVVKVYLGCTEALEEPAAAEQWVAANGKWYACGDWNERLILEDRPSGHTRVLADLGFETRTGNSGALFVPTAFTKSDRDLVLKAWMGSPGAGGGDLIYGDERLSRATGRRRNAP